MSGSKQDSSGLKRGETHEVSLNSMNHLFKSESYIFEIDRRLILFDVLRGDFFEIDEVTHDVLAACDGQAPEEVLSVLDERYHPEEIQAALEELERAEVLTEEPLKIAPFHPPSRIELSHMSLCVTRDKAESERRKAKSAHSALRPSPFALCSEASRLTPLYMSEAVALGAMDLLLRESGMLRDCEVTFEGGEPLLNVPLLRRVIEYAEEQARDLGKRITFEVVTDGALLTRRIVDYFSEKDVAVVLEVGADGDPDVLGQVASVLRAGPHPVTLHIQVVATGRSLDLQGRIEALLRRFPFATSIGVRWANLPAEHPDALRAERLPGVRSALRGLSRHTLRHLLHRGETIVEEIEGPMAQLMERQVLLYSCGAGTRSVTVSPEGTLFPCSDLVGWKPLRMGDVFSGIDADRYRRWLQELHVERREPCRTCWARYLCGGGCCADAVLTTGDAATPNPVSCERIRHTYELAMAVCLEADEQAPSLLPSRYLTGHTVSPEVQVSDERPVLERYA